ncbi:hypothetical protein E2C01_100695 [Portunus trituberculatus]|uniref:Uncharacterized protein n=1 Tax=Portunus trituberculatus TaxID=210409 RepID=A0A5B7KIK4_PORTR|nr:hypothetical protein [Portunus trituberculatus]
MLQRTCLVLAVVVMVVVVRQAAAEPHYKVYDKDDDCSTTILYTTTKGEVSVSIPWLHSQTLTQYWDHRLLPLGSS